MQVMSLNVALVQRKHKLYNMIDMRIIFHIIDNLNDSL